MSGVARGLNGSWATAISRRVVLSADHAKSSGEIHFFSSNEFDPADRVVRNVVSGQKVPGTDLYLAVLDSDLPSSITQYSLASELLSGVAGGTPLVVANAGSMQNVQAFMVVTSPGSGSLGNTGRIAVGTNRVTGYSENVPFDPNLAPGTNFDADALILARDDVGGANYTTHEASFRGGDSGGATFIEVNGKLQLIGINAFIYGNSDFDIGGTGSGISYVGNQYDYIQQFVSAVPEPGSASLVAVVAGCGLWRRRLAA